MNPAASRIALGFALALAFVAARRAPQEDAASAVVLGEGAHRYRWVSHWAQVPEEKELGNTHGSIAVDSEGRIYVNTDTERAVMVFEPDGRFVRAFGAEWKGGLHGMRLLRDADGTEFLLVAHIGRGEVARLSLAGQVAWTLGCPMESGLYADASEYHPTSAALAPDGRLYVADGYGKSWIHVYGADRTYLRSFGGPGSEPGKLATPHGLWIDTRGESPRLLVADRENHRVQAFDLDGKLLGVLEVELRRPCSFYQRGDELVIADLAGRVTILDREDHLVEHLGDQPNEGLRAQNGVPREQWTDGLFLAPHSAAWDARGDLYVMDWNFLGRVTKLEHVGG